MPPQRITKQVAVEDHGYDTPCWIWLLYRDKDGYGRYTAGTTRWLAHRWYYEQHVGPIPDGLEIDHLCRVRACVNPEHMEPVTHAENSRRGIQPGSLLTHCIHGHEFTPENTYARPGGGRDCRTCIRERVARYNARKAAA